MTQEVLGFRTSHWLNAREFGRLFIASFIIHLFGRSCVSQIFSIGCVFGKLFIGLFLMFGCFRCPNRRSDFVHQIIDDFFDTLVSDKDIDYVRIMEL